MEGSLNKTISHPYLEIKCLLFYWLLAIEIHPNIINSTVVAILFSGKSGVFRKIDAKKYTKFSILPIPV